MYTGFHITNTHILIIIIKKKSQLVFDFLEILILNFFATDLHGGDGIPNLLLLKEYQNAPGKILE